MISSAEINLGEHFGSIQLIEQVFNLREWVFILDGHLVEFTVIHTQSYGTISLVHKQNRRSPG
jgi:hypothetical protein